TQLPRAELRRVAPQRPTTITIGVFDGVHRGHVALLRRVIDRAAANGSAAGVVTFHPHPQHVLRPDVPLSYLTSLEDRLSLLTEAGLELVAPITFTSELSQPDASDFVRLLVEELRLTELVTGPDFALGRQRGGDIATLRALGDELGFRVTVIDMVRDGGPGGGPNDGVDADAKISSSDIRDGLAAADVARVNDLLGRRFSLHGPIVRGQERGRGIGFPTANIAVGPDQALPATGVYATLASIDGRLRPSATNIGVRPTFDDHPAVTVECHILDYAADLYGRDLRIDFVSRLRGEVKFDGVEALTSQLARDCRDARAAIAAAGDWS
ncbi:MAG: bifunctional riboflavin kinase/FAD synthetase, partial [Chloroflexota bacterium]|nr:bifunctional riboflavin kinase/FAD synthetase [Chloroflexota bacterium]